MTLDEMKPGNECRIVKVNMGGVVGQRLLDMGFMPGTTISVIRNAPLMDPIDVKVKGYMLALRRSEAKGVEVTSL
ncbi:MAG: ferrous iron transport protein A [Deltaproteobacteria bacterium]|nr:ferrous iron transport protein A [Deltaproteobacteria bacterium]MBW2019770.1 ferrous iron transport protein A [Deltaproteobacteria bacterium]MBW2074650.1 ferrous iron transport protein A [Deltaproteobacteria bacterium]RLB83469.1 MAG: iron transporter FeoA [Deltaproteobacteria bacterium]